MIALVLVIVVGGVFLGRALDRELRRPPARTRVVLIGEVRWFLLAELDDPSAPTAHEIGGALDISCFLADAGERP